MLRSRSLRLAFALALLLGAAGHLWTWYWPRERAAAADFRTAPGALCRDESFDACLWLPYPHQNLSVAKRAIADFDAVVAAAARLAHLPPPRPFRFGPFAAPPARELALATSLDGTSFRIEARVYPTIAVLARLAGLLAGNPWLKGGEIESGGKRLTVRWEGRRWIVEPAAGAGGGKGAATNLEQTAPGLALFRLGREVRGVPAGTYLLRHTARGFELASALAPRREAFDIAETEVAALALDGTESGAPKIGALFASERAFVPRVAVLSRPRQARFKLPGERLFKLVGEEMPEGEASGWAIKAIDVYAYDKSLPLAAHLATSRVSELRLALWLRPASAHQVAKTLADALAKVPLISDKEVQRWRDVTAVLTPLTTFDTISLEAGRERESLVLELRR